MSNLSPLPHVSLDSRLVECAKRAARAERKRHDQECAARSAWKRDADKTVLWLREIERQEAQPVMAAIAKAEVVAGRRLAVGIDKDLVLCSRGFRVTAPTSEMPVAVLLNFTTYRLRRSNMWLGKKLVAEGEALKSRVRRSLIEPDIENRLIYQGLDEWSLAGKLCWYGAVLGTAGLPWWLLVYQTHADAFRRAFQPVDRQALSST